jgi:hypothetical protein
MNKLINFFFIGGAIVLIGSIAIVPAADAMKSEANAYGHKLGSVPISQMMENAPKNNPFD